MNSTSPWYAESLRWVASLFIDAADYLERPTAAVAPMPRHISYDEILGDVRNRVYTGFGADNRPYY